MYFQAMVNQAEKRRFPRVSVNFVTVEVYSESGEPEAPELSFVINVSEDGMMFRGQRMYDKAQRILVTFTIPDDDAVIRTDAVVIHRQELATSKFYGIQFKDICASDKHMIREFIERYLKES
ncbi:MAG: hypothetical protein GF398_05015 [Chitinivibrionales bacterium]|nr:hypothetical protein [Chitinivibrionales bacterium]